MLYPLSYEGGGCRKRGRKPDAMVGSGRHLLHLGRSTAFARPATVVGGEKPSCGRVEAIA